MEVQDVSDSQIIRSAAFRAGMRQLRAGWTKRVRLRGRRTDLPLIDGMARAAFAAQLRNGVAAARLGGRLPAELRHSLNKLGYAAEGSFSLQEFFEKKNCSH